MVSRYYTGIAQEVPQVYWPWLDNKRRPYLSRAMYTTWATSVRAFEQNKESEEEGYVEQHQPQEDKQKEDEPKEPTRKKRRLNDPPRDLF